MNAVTTDLTLTPAEFSRATGLSLSYTYSLVWSGRIEAVKRDGVWQIPLTEVEKRRRKEAVLA